MPVSDTLPEALCVARGLPEPLPEPLPQGEAEGEGVPLLDSEWELDVEGEPVADGVGLPLPLPLGLALPVEEGVSMLVAELLRLADTDALAEGEPDAEGVLLADGELQPLALDVALFEVPPVPLFVAVVQAEEEADALSH